MNKTAKINRLRFVVQFGIFFVLTVISGIFLLKVFGIGYFKGISTFNNYIRAVSFVLAVVMWSLFIGNVLVYLKSGKPLFCGVDANETFDEKASSRT